ncbi:L-aminoadipate-semialdehyde dehydrogenase-phosphopantetheinyl transferase-like isoform X2 [Pomacea canaliculata]|uniref:L-aminoadipate-semialdehyde dehydrogenase-phosphopantetheinyl transferase-like isoform X2 n=1 Tax=Pomacea canaliculata TaxID=400727 RepID=UPI000D729FE2|nr:L-aminoadipate-semialdehyde dehydrogenase-phosphopantetheinyl transferase-like isoform X2 [Pomacea canaliculata]
MTILSCSSRESLRIAVKAKTWSPSQYEWLLAAQCIQPEEKERIGRFFFKKDAKLAVVGRLLIRAAVSSMMGLPYGQIKLSRTEKGKPYILNQPNGKTPSNRCNFNISHQGDYVVLAAEAQKLIGIDVMKVEWPRSTGIQDFFRTMERQLTPSEWSRVRCQTSDMQQLSVFYRFWCLKESYVKALGVGIGFEVSRLTFDISAEDLTPGVVTVSTTLSVDGVPADDWTFEETMLEDHCVAVATKPETDREQANDSQGERKGLAFTVWSVQDLLRKCEPLPGSEPDLLYWKHFSAKDEEPRGPRQ